MKNILINKFWRKNFLIINFNNKNYYNALYFKEIAFNKNTGNIKIINKFIKLQALCSQKGLAYGQAVHLNFYFPKCWVVPKRYKFARINPASSCPGTGV